MDNVIETVSYPSVQETESSGVGVTLLLRVKELYDEDDIKFLYSKTSSFNFRIKVKKSLIIKYIFHGVYLQI